MKQVRLFDSDNQGYMDAARFYMDLPFRGMEYFEYDALARKYVITWDDGKEEMVEWNT